MPADTGAWQRRTGLADVHPETGRWARVKGDPMPDPMLEPGCAHSASHHDGLVPHASAVGPSVGGGHRVPFEPPGASTRGFPGSAQMLRQHAQQTADKITADVVEGI